MQLLHNIHTGFYSFYESENLQPMPKHRLKKILSTKPD